MSIDTHANDDRLIVALMSSVAPASARDADEFESFETLDSAREWVEEQLRADVARHGSGWDFQADVAWVTRAEFRADTWGVVDDMIARATWDSATNSVAWQNDGPFDFADCRI
ncbi:hypothetical protein [Nocardia sp. XZ_19_369]|uniref:hypothetical protein n=1 Tax=Nocardia sp. XZ_19_369 TaxID=2769487 RepID=UPI00188FFF4D|nr:hypothetical protein [Nocardia sp. XZ_19_369]